MTGYASVRASRDGDQFHYHWAARRCLELLPGGSDLAAITIEGASATEGDWIDAGEELIDVGFYYGSEDRTTARRVSYVQLKHSTLRATDPWTASGLKDTLKGFAKRYRELVAELTASVVAARFRFKFTTNRPIHKELSAALVDLAAGKTSRYPALQAQLIGYTSLEEDATAFFTLFTAEGGEDDLWAQRNLLTQNVQAYLPDADFDAPVQLKELITRKATTEFATNPSVRRTDVLRALKATEDALMPAPNQIAEPQRELSREQEPEILARLLDATTPLIIHAEGGVGKSILAARLARAMISGSVAILYDCYGNGLYRTSLNARHRHRDALVQMANELAARGLCHPLIPSAGADAKAYMQAFLFRLEQASTILRARTPGALLCLIIDAADNAEMAAEDLSESASFVPDLIRAPLPTGARLAFTCRTHRQNKLAAPLDAVAIELKPFSHAETAGHLRNVYPAAAQAEVTEFAFLSSSNPRVQAFAMSRQLLLYDMLRELGPTPTTVEDVLSNLLDHAIVKLKNAEGAAQAARIDRLCEALAVLRPLVPIAVLARLAGTSESEVRSFALDLGRPLFVKGGSLHFLDEPAETWFRERFKPDATAMAGLLDRIRPLTSGSSYAAAILPELLLQVGRLDELVSLALSGEGLPDDPIARRDVELQRLIFALKACLQQKRALPAAKLALKAAGETAGELRQIQLIQDNTDLAAILLAPDRLQEIVAGRQFGSSWMGSRHAYDAGLLSGREDLAPEASSRLRMAMEWLEAWARTSHNDEDRKQVSDRDRVELATALLRLRSPGRAAHFLRRWRYRRHAMVAGAKLGRRLVDIGRTDQIDEMASAAGNDLWLVLGLTSAARDAGHRLPAAVLSRLMRLLADRRVLLSDSQEISSRWDLLEAITSAVEMTLMAKAASKDQAAAVLNRYLPTTPPSDMTSRYGVDRTPLLRAYALDAALRGRTVKLVDVAPESARAQLKSGSDLGPDQDTRFFKHEIGGLLPWFILRADVTCGRMPTDLGASIDTARKATASAETSLYEGAASAWQVAAYQWFQVLRDAGTAGTALYALFAACVSEGKIRLRAETAIGLCRHAARTDGQEKFAMTLAIQALEALHGNREDAESRLADLTKLARAILPVSRSEAAAVLDRAVEFASQVGDENLDRWDALLNLASAAADPVAPKARSAHRLSRAAELTYEYVARDKHFDWTRTVHDLTDLCPSSTFAILSRWRDRRFGYSERLLPLAVERLVDQNRLPLTAPIAFAGCDAEWDRLATLTAAAEGLTEPTAREAALQIAYRYIRLRPYGQDTWIKISGLSRRLGIDFPDIDRLVAVTTIAPAEPVIAEAQAAAEEPEKGRTPDWDEIFADLCFTDAGALRAAYDAVRTYDPPYQFEVFFREAIVRARVGREPELIEALASWADFGRFELRYLLEALPTPLPGRPALRGAVRNIVLAVCRRQPESIWRRGWNALIPFERLVTEGVVTDAAVVTATVEGFAAKVDCLSASGLFRTIDALAAQLSPTEADEALHYGLDLLEGLLRAEDADGPWRPALEPPIKLPSALAGYIWAGLGSPVAAVRWQFAHVVRSVVELGWTDLLDAILVWAEGEGAGPFTDQGLEFYLWHARQWLTIGLARAAQSAPRRMTSAASLLRTWTALPHVLIREMAAQALKTLAAAGVISEGDAVDPAVLNRPAQPAKRYRGWVAPDVDAGEQAAEAQPSDGEQYYFGIDIVPYWFGPLGRAFGLTEADIERRASATVRGRFAWPLQSWRADARYARKIFDDSETRHSHGGLPRTDDLPAYHGYHAMMIVAAELLETHQVRWREDDDTNGFDDWLDNNRLTRRDGGWLADRRDPRLIKDSPAMGHGERTSWRWEVSRAYLDAQLDDDRGGLVVWGHWHTRNGEQTETVSVRSALVTRGKAESLLAALQTAKNPSRYILPDADYSDSLEAKGFRCAPWIHDGGRDLKLDEYDPWASRLHYPGPSPAAEVIAALSLTEDADLRAWRDDGEGLLHTETWTQHVGYGREADILKGWRLSANRAFLAALFRAQPDDSLIVCVSVRRDGYRYASDKDNFEKYPWPYELYYLMGPDGVAHPF